VGDFAASTARLAELADDVRVVYVCHYSRYAADARFLVELANAFADIVGGQATWRDTIDVFGDLVHEACFPTVSVYVSQPMR
jgi:hypothetical protein